MELKEGQIQLFLDSIYNKYGYDFRGYAMASLTRRIKRFIDLNQASGLEEIEQKLLNDEELFKEFVEELTVNVTEMFRDPSFYKKLREIVIPQLKTYPYIRIWDAGCSSGEEAYSLAILLHEEGIYDRCQIYATDINQKVVNQAKEGIFRMQNMKEYISNYHASGGKEEFSDYYTAKYNCAVINDFLKKNMIFSVHNLVTDGSFNEFNLIICRNVLIYFKKELQEKVISLFYHSLPVFGYLGLGNKETLSMSELKDKFSDVERDEKIYKRII